MRPLAFSTWSTCSCSASAPPSAASRSMSAMKPWMAPPAFAQRLEALRSDAARRQVDHALEGGIVAAVGEEPEIRERVLDLGALEEPQPAVDPVRDARRQERLLEHPRLRVGAVEDRDLAPRAPACHVLADAVGHELRLVPLVEGGVEADRLATRTGRPELLAEAAGVVPDEPVGGFQDGAGGAGVLLEAEQLRPRVVAAELLQVPGARAPEAVDRVVRDDAAGNEVVRALDVEIIDLARVWLSLDALHDVEAVRVGRDHHAGSDSRSRDEGQRALVHEPLQH